ncbi:BlaI/MecI/CopY family transcriptional regulator [Neiella sp. HB171785]|uniref:BlaI/MecI/CopY family transcriptional regulator n=1 Tax=Neiella litorisoli TaxID=2771431 RepID=A0A8J6QG75_9GAMM|nr:BlaI/MecI/CopY family transcriptional regulator [Neiella litorisoli]MBD1389304.1 BlaI/MecI/CopY family transcriptional regulator [Neiella litorisoli]
MKLSDFELDVLQLFWQHGDCSAKQIHEWVCETKPSAYTTVKTIVDRLEDKGAIKRVGKDGRAFVFQTQISKDDLTPSILPSFVKRFFAGNASSLITHLIDDEKLSDDELEYLENYLAKKKKSKS